LREQDQREKTPGETVTIVDCEADDLIVLELARLIHAPGALFLAEAGGRAASLDGWPYRVVDAGSGLLLAHNEAIWQ
jgi:fructose-1,6-bisphosphatase/inositol monophosphatase family enzyme